LEGPDSQYGQLLEYFKEFLGTGVEVVQPQRTQLADVRLPELEDESSGGGSYVKQPSDVAAVVAAAGSALAAEQTSRAAHDILAAAKTVGVVTLALHTAACLLVPKF
jgi:hypothetical protein